LARSNDGHPDAGRRLRSWALEAGFPADDVTSSASSWVFADDADLKWWTDLWADRTTKSTAAEQYVAKDIASAPALTAIAEGLREWATREGAWFNVVHGEIICVA